MAGVVLPFPPPAWRAGAGAPAAVVAVSAAVRAAPGQAAAAAAAAALTTTRPAHGAIATTTPVRRKVGRPRRRTLTAPLVAKPAPCRASLRQAPLHAQGPRPLPGGDEMGLAGGGAATGGS